MFEGQRLGYIVPGYTGYIPSYSVIFPLKFMTSSSLKDSQNQQVIFQDMLDM